MTTILIIDDQPTDREYLVTLLAESGNRLLQAADGDEALAIAQAEHPDLVIADILMPTMDGSQLIRRLRADPLTENIPVIFCTLHYHEREARALARACGVAHVLTKPGEPEVVLRTVKAALEMIEPATPSPASEETDHEHLRLLTDRMSEKVTELRIVNARSAALIDLGVQLGSERDVARLLQRFCSAARRIIGARYAIVSVTDSDGAAASHGFFTSGMDVQTVSRLGSPDSIRESIANVAGEFRCRRLDIPGGDPVALGFPASYPPFHSWLSAPIASAGRVYGWLGLIDKIGTDAFSDEDERVAGILTAQVGRIYENGSLNADLRRRAAELEAEVAERKQVEKALVESKARKGAILDSALDCIVSMDKDGLIREFNPAAEKVFGYRRADLLGKSLAEKLIPPRLREKHRAGLARFLATHEGTVLDRRIEMIGMRADGTELPIELSITHFQVQGEPMFTGIIRDITERKQLEDQFRQAQKLESVGRLAGGVAHDFNNLLTIINGYGELVLNKLPSGDPLRELIREILDAGNRAAGLTRQLLAFSRKSILEPRVLDLKEVVVDIEKMLRRIIGEDIQLVLVVDPDLGSVKGDLGQLEQVIMNLAVNAQDAMPRGGSVTIELRNIELDEAYTLGHAEAHPGPHVLLALTDTGCGMDPATMSRIFEPFFTTKGERGTGLGLATVHGIVEQCGGHVVACSEVGHGTTFKVYLPRVEQPASRKSHPGLAVAPRGSETLLLVEDEDGVRALSRHILQTSGYTVLEARDGAEALQVASQHSGRLDLIVTDVVMPHMGGRETAERVAGMHPGVKVLFLSGYTDDAVVRHGILQAEVAFLQKPFSPASLARKVREILDGKTEGKP